MILQPDDTKTGNTVCRENDPLIIISQNYLRYIKFERLFVNVCRIYNNRIKRGVENCLVCSISRQLKN